MSLPALAIHPDGFYSVVFLLWLLAAALGAVRSRGARMIQPVLVAAGSGLLFLAAVVGGDGSLALPQPWFLGDARFRLVVDPLSRWFLAIIGFVGLAASLFSPGYLLPLR